MNNHNTNYTYGQINSRDILAEPSYQRNVDYGRVKNIVSNFNASLVNPVKVSKRDGKYYVFDGQHTLAALKMKNGNKDLMVECKIYRDLTLEEEARLFAQQNGISRAVKANARMKALYASGDVDMVELYNLINGMGITFDFAAGKGHGRLIAYATICKIFKCTYKNDFVSILEIIRDAWGGAAESYSKEILSGMHIFYTIYKENVDRKKAISQFSKVSPLAIIREGKAYKDGGDKRFARQLVYTYNAKLRTGRLNDYELEK